MENTFKEGDHVRVSGVGVIAYTDEKLAAGQTGVISCVIAKGVGYDYGNTIARQNKESL